MHPKGGLLAYFLASVKQDMGSIVTAITTDKTDKLLLTGDSLGYVRKWNIATYCTGEKTGPMQNIFQTYERQISQVVSRSRAYYIRVF